MDELTAGRQPGTKDGSKFWMAKPSFRKGKKTLDAAQALYDQGVAAFAEAQAKLEAGEAELEAGRETLEQNQAEYEKGLAQWQQGSEQLGQLQQLADGEEAYRAGVQQMVDQLTEAGLSITYEEADALIRELAALDEFPSTAQELLQYILAWLQQGDCGNRRIGCGGCAGQFPHRRSILCRNRGFCADACHA